MPYKLRKKGKGYKVCKPSGKCFSKKPLPKKRAIAQMAAIRINEEDNIFEALIQSALYE